MKEYIIEATLQLLNPRSWIEFVWKMSLLCALTTMMGYLVEFLMGIRTVKSVPQYFVLVSVIAIPFFSVAMVAVRRMYALQVELEKLATTDLLTGLGNRRAFFDGTDFRSGGQILLLDIDHFKRINDNYGHTVGDAVLRAVAAHLRANLRENDLVARIGGEEFAVFLPGTNGKRARDVGERLVAGLTFEQDGLRPITVTLSAGLADTKQAASMSELVRRADEALYKAKNDGRARLTQWISSTATGRKSYSAATFDDPSIPAR